MLPVILIRLLWLSLRIPGYRRNWSGRFGYGPENVSEEKIIWIHAVSVGEVKAASRLILAVETALPDYRIVVSTTTPTGKITLQKEFGDRVSHFYIAYDVPLFVRRMLQRLKPAICVLMETEIWPNLYHQCNSQNIPLLIANARLSGSSFRGYQKLAGLTQTTLQHVNLVLAQSAADAERFIALGCAAERVEVTGNLKFDLSTDLVSVPGLLEPFNKVVEGRFTWIAASTHEGEEEIILAAHEKLISMAGNALLIIAPRHPQRFDKVAALCSQHRFVTKRISEISDESQDIEVVLVDSIGELQKIFPLAKIAFVGGSLVPAGGHNMLEPASMGLPVLSGPAFQNFLEIAELLEKSGAMQVVNDRDSLVEALSGLMDDERLRESMGEKGRQVVKTHSGASQKTIKHIQAMLS